MGISFAYVPPRLPYAVSRRSYLLPFPSYQVTSEHRTADDENSLFLPSYPLDDLICALCQCRSTSVGWRHGVEFEKRGAPRKRYTCCVCLMVDFQGGGFVVDVRVEFVV